MTPESLARIEIDSRLEKAGWIVQDLKKLDLSAGLGVAVREYPTDTGPADYVLFIARQAVGVIEAKRDSAAENLTATEAQTERYATARLKWRKGDAPLRFLFEATGQIIRFTDGADPAPRSREIFHFFKPETLATWLYAEAARGSYEEGAIAALCIVVAGLVPVILLARSQLSRPTKSTVSP